ncbi:MSHA pilin protein MshD [Colwellia chukchiensis]|uniref:MSHA pilin protein MshD n=1 Tax=Colwellia chukchiensis TaxID=641665 RepID=A0A1H7LB85_9GAMM|nr:prepilin-type N-terminal cleavage/methylation domain-containing protein [Colwellia chukchiensis]SEK95765.1 MSHA pilin protein MshD [Colwellia chukchiensis]
MRSNFIVSVKTAKFSRHQVQGFTLIETIVGIVVLAIAFAIFTRLIYPLANQSAEQVHQIKAAELAQSMINEILGKAFDENSDMSGSLVRCGEDVNRDGVITAAAGESPCSQVLSNEEAGDRALFDDVDDYNGLTVIANSLGDGLANIYLGYQINVQVVNDSNYDGVSDGSDNNYTAKLITVTVTTPQDFDFVFSVYRANF